MPTTPDEADPAARKVHPLAAKEEMIRDRFERFADRVYRLREQLQGAEPENAARLDRVLQRAGELGLADRLDELVDLLEKSATRYRAVDAQAAWLADIDRLLAILMERDSLNAERERRIQRLEEYRRKVGELLEKQRDLRGATGGEPDPGAPQQGLSAQLDQAVERLDALLEAQQKLSASAKEVAEGGARTDPDAAAKALGGAQDALSQEGSRLAEDLERLASPPQEESAESPEAADARKAVQQGAGKVQDGAESMSQAAKRLQAGNAGAAGRQQQDAEQALREAREQLEQARQKLQEQDAGRRREAPGESDPQQLGAEQQKLADETGQLSDEMKRDAAGGQGGPPGQQGGQQGSPSPGQQSLDNAQGEMEDASQSLQESAPQDATPHQDKAIEELEQAQKELEQALQQLRQEEREETLRDLEARFRQMLSKQQAINEATLQLDAIGEENFRRAEQLEAADLSVRERALSDDAATCLHILIEDGTTVAFPRVVEQLAEDMATVAVRLAELRVGVLTQTIEREIVETLEQMLEAVQRMQQENEQQGMPAGAMAEGMSPLLPPSAELKLLRASQLRINERTAVIESGLREPAEPPESLHGELQKVAQRQQECAKIAQEMRDRQEQH